MVRRILPEDKARFLALVRQYPALGIKLEVEYKLLCANASLPYNFYMVDDSAVLAQSKTHTTLCGVPPCREELESFLSFSGVQSLFSSGWVPTGWGTLSLQAMRWGGAVSKDFAAETEEVEEPFCVNEFMEVIGKDGALSAQQCENLMVDLCVRRNHGFAKMYGVRKSGRAVAVAGAVCITSSAVYIGDVETAMQHRGNGYASCLVRRICKDFADKKIVLICEAEQAPFYERLGFFCTQEKVLLCVEG